MRATIKNQASIIIGLQDPNGMLDIYKREFKQDRVNVWMFLKYAKTMGYFPEDGFSKDAPALGDVDENGREVIFVYSNEEIYCALRV